MMDAEMLEKRMEFWKRGLLVSIGASVTLLATTITEFKDETNFRGWYLVWLVIWLAVAPPGFYLLMSKKWRQLAMSSRLNTAFGYLGCTWLILLSASIRYTYGSGTNGCYTFLIIAAIVLGVIYRYLQKKGNGPEAMFP
jgi:FtsH-binding integral membrane protein